MSQIMLAEAEYFARNLVKREFINVDGLGKAKNVTHSLIISISLVRNNFIRKRLITKSSEERSCFDRQRASVA